MGMPRRTRTRTCVLRRRTATAPRDGAAALRHAVRTTATSKAAAPLRHQPETVPGPPKRAVPVPRIRDATAIQAGIPTAAAERITTDRTKVFVRPGRL